MSYEPMQVGALPPKQEQVIYPAVEMAQPVEPTKEKECTKIEDADDDGIDDKSPGDVPAKYLNLEFEAVFHQHEQSKLAKPVQKYVGLVYKWIKLIVYHVFALVIGLPLMIIWAIIMGLMAFVYSWIYAPTLRLTIFWLAATLPIVTMPLVAIYRPLVDVGARCFRQIRVKAWTTKSTTKEHIV